MPCDLPRPGPKRVLKNFKKDRRVGGNCPDDDGFQSGFCDFFFDSTSSIEFHFIPGLELLLLLLPVEGGPCEAGAARAVGTEYGIDGQTAAPNPRGALGFLLLVVTSRMILHILTALKTL